MAKIGEQFGISESAISWILSGKPHAPRRPEKKSEPIFPEKV